MEQEYWKILENLTVFRKTEEKQYSKRTNSKEARPLSRKIVFSKIFWLLNIIAVTEQKDWKFLEQFTVVWKKIAEYY